jgi:ATP adenylyltransferase
MEFIRGPKPPGCFFCEAASADPARDAEHYVLARTPDCIALLNIYPYNNGHLMVAPRRHVSNLEELERQTAADLMALTQKAVRVLKQVLKPDGFNLGFNLGKVAGAGVADHVHQHVVPRWEGDTNFMPVLSDAKVMSQHLRTSYAEIRTGFERQL